MDVLVIHYTDWIGYHVVNTLLNEGYKVAGVEKKTGNPMLKDYFSRNSNFQHVEDLVDRKFSRVVCIGGNQDNLHQVCAEHYFLINPVELSERDNSISIQVPHLFGEFMLMDKQGFYEDSKKIRFSSDVFKEEAIYIADFLKDFIEWFQSPPRFKEITVKSEKYREKQGVILENMFFIHENIPIRTQLQNVIDHYEQYKALYPKIIED